MTELENELLNNEQSIKVLQIMIDTIQSRTTEILVEQQQEQIYKFEAEPVLVKEMSNEEVKQYKIWQRLYLNRVMESAFNTYYSS